MFFIHLWKIMKIIYFHYYFYFSVGFFSEGCGCEKSSEVPVGGSGPKPWGKFYYYCICYIIILIPFYLLLCYCNIIFTFIWYCEVYYVYYNIILLPFYLLLCNCYIIIINNTTSKFIWFIYFERKKNLLYFPFPSFRCSNCKRLL